MCKCLHLPHKQGWSKRCYWLQYRKTPNFGQFTLKSVSSESSKLMGLLMDAMLNCWSASLSRQTSRCIFKWFTTFLDTLTWIMSISASSLLIQCTPVITFSVHWNTTVKYKRQREREFTCLNLRKRELLSSEQLWCHLKSQSCAELYPAQTEADLEENTPGWWEDMMHMLSILEDGRAEALRFR